MEKELKTLLDAVKTHYPNADLGSVQRAFEFARAAHEGQRRKSGGPYLTHTYNSALLLAKWRMPPPLVIAGLLHDVPEDTRHSLADIEKNFGKDIASVVEGETKLSILKYRGRERYAENLRKMFMAIAKDVRVVIVKFADRIDNMQTIDIFPADKQLRIARETLEIYAPIANRLGMGAIRGELEDLSFKYVYPKEYEWVIGLVADKIEPRKKYLEKIKVVVEKDLKSAHITPVSLHGRVKHLYSMYKKLLEKDRDIERIYDLVALRIIVPALPDCYAALGIIHQRWRPLKGRIKDYIAQPKPNGYQSIHTTVFCEDGEIVEFQIRTAQMHEEAEFGIAAHWFYTEKGKKSVAPDTHVGWLKDLAELQKNIQDKSKFLEALESLKIDFFRKRIFVFTPKGDVIDLPEDATPVDYAYAIHTDVGNKCVGSRVNDALVPLDTKLQNGDVVEIIRDKNRKGPSVDWMKFVKTKNAREKIKSHARVTLAGWLKQKVLPAK